MSAFALYQTLSTDSSPPARKTSLQVHFSNIMQSVVCLCGKNTTAAEAAVFKLAQSRPPDSYSWNPCCL